MRAYPATLNPDQDGGFTVTFRDVPEAITEGDTREEALLRAEDALECACYVHWAKEPPAASSPGGGGRGNGAAFGAGDGKNRILRRDAPMGREWSASISIAVSAVCTGISANSISATPTA
jgi:hypothetical protein